MPEPIAIVEWGRPTDPGIILVPAPGESPSAWREIAEDLAAAGRHVVAYNSQDGGQRSDLVADLRRIVEALSARPVIVGRGAGAMIAALAIGECQAPIASGFIAIEPHDRAPELDPKLDDAMARIRVPALIVGGANWPAPAGAELATSPEADGLAALLIAFLERRIPRTPIRYESGADPRTLRDALGSFATGITIITALDPDGNPVGLTANSFTSVSLDPPLILVCIARSASSIAAFEVTEHFAINMLHIGQQPTSDLFARKDADRFALTAHEQWESGVPIVSGSLASFECSLHQAIDGGDHLILIGRVERAQFEPDRDPLLYFRGKYRRLHFA